MLQRDIAKMYFKYLFVVFPLIYASPAPETFVQINKYDFSKRNHFNQLQVIKNILLEDLMLTSDNLKVILNMEQAENGEKKIDLKPSLIPDYDDISDEEVLKNQAFKEDLEKSLDAKNQQNEYLHQKPQELSMLQPSRLLLKRQVGDSGGNTQMVLGTFQAMMRPMSISDLPSLAGSQISNDEVLTE